MELTSPLRGTLQTVVSRLASGLSPESAAWKSGLSPESATTADEAKRKLHGHADGAAARLTAEELEKVFGDDQGAAWYQVRVQKDAAPSRIGS